MARKPRCYVPGAFYHVIARGNYQQAIFRDERYYLHYLSLMEENATKHSVIVHAYVLMTNHLHLLVQGGEQPLGRFMQGVQQSYTQYVNTRNQQTGHLFQGRYKAILIEDDEYLLSLVRYIHLNPVQAGLVADPLDYRWSSHRHYFCGEGEGRVETGFVKGVMTIYGGKEIADYQLLSAKNCPTEELTPLSTLVDRVAKFTQLAPEEITGKGKGRAASTARQLLMYVATNQGHPMTNVASYLGHGRSSISMAIRAIDEDLQRGGAWAKRLGEYHDDARNN